MYDVLVAEHTIYQEDDDDDDWNALEFPALSNLVTHHKLEEANETSPPPLYPWTQRIHSEWQINLSSTPTGRRRPPPPTLVVNRREIINCLFVPNFLPRSPPSPTHSQSVPLGNFQFPAQKCICSSFNQTVSLTRLLRVHVVWMHFLRQSHYLHPLSAATGLSLSLSAS